MEDITITVLYTSDGDLQIDVAGEPTLPEALGILRLAEASIVSNSSVD